jgi:hypothetical protein
VNSYRRDTTPVTDQFGAGLTHQVFDAHATHRVQGARLRTVCGRYVTPAPMIGPVGAPCPVCVAILNEHGDGHREHTSSRWRHRPTGLRRLWSWFRG